MRLVKFWILNVRPSTGYFRKLKIRRIHMALPGVNNEYYNPQLFFVYIFWLPYCCGIVTSLRDRNVLA